MFFSVEQLSVLSTNCLQIGANFSLLRRGLSVSSGKALCSKIANSIIKISASGSGLDLYFHTHAWSGTSIIIGPSGVSEVDLYSETPDERIIRIDNNEGGDFDVVLVAAAGESNRNSKGKETWLLGVDFDQRQSWLPLEMPASDWSRLVYGKYGSFLVPTMDAVIGATILNTGVWAEKDIEFFSKIIQPGMTVFDIGANIGHHSVVFSKLVGPEGRVCAFEPQSLMFRYACANLALNNCSNTKIFPSCLGDENGFVSMFPVSYESRNNFGALGVNRTVDDSEINKGETVSVYRLDTLISSEISDLDSIDFIKIDVQSYEYFVLQGGIESINRWKPFIFMEISPSWMKLRGYDYKKIYELLEEIGYEFSYPTERVGVRSGIREWSGADREEWDVFCSPIKEKKIKKRRRGIV